MRRLGNRQDLLFRSRLTLGFNHKRVVLVVEPVFVEVFSYASPSQWFEVPMLLDVQR